MLVNLNGKIIQILMNYSIGIELENKGHDFGYSNFSNKQYKFIKKINYFF